MNHQEKVVVTQHRIGDVLHRQTPSGPSLVSQWAAVKGWPEATESRWLLVRFPASPASRSRRFRRRFWKRSCTSPKRLSFR